MNNKLFLSLLVAVSCSHAMAGWVKAASSEKSVFYIDSAISKKVGTNVMIWLLRDHTELQHDRSEPYRSSKDQIEVNCQGRRIRRIFSSDHPQPMGEGKPVHSEHGPMSWNDAAPNTIVKRIVDIACVRA